VEAHFLAAGRDVERAYYALERGEEAQAREDISEARRLIDSALVRSPAAADLPRYANQRAELLELQGDAEAANRIFARLAPTHPLSAVQAAMVSWRLSTPGTAIRYGLDMVKSALSRLEADPEAADDSQGWSFRIGGAQQVSVSGKVDKACLTDWVAQTSRALLAASEPELAPAEL
jgi:tetratricopeptide (TPR) repeat protein